MVVLYVRGLPVGPLDENKDRLPTLLLQGEDVEFRSETGEKLGYFGPKPEPIIPWHPEMSQEDIDKMAADGKGMKLEEFWQKMGVK